jgi:hypothetical protein
MPSSAERFPNLIENGEFESYYPPSKPDVWRFEPETSFLWDLFSRPGGNRSLFVGAAMIAPLEYARVSCRLKPQIKPQTAYLFEGSFIRNRNIDGVYPTVSLFGQDRRLSDFWASGKWQKISLIFQSPATLNSADTAWQFLEIKVPRDNYVLWLDNLSLREIKAVPVSPADDARVNRDSIEFTSVMPRSDRLLDVVLVLCSDKHFRAPNLLKFRTNNAGNGRGGGQGNGDGESHFDNAVPSRPSCIQEIRFSVPNQLKNGNWYWRLEVYQYRTRLAVSDPKHFFIEKEHRSEGLEGGEAAAHRYDNICHNERPEEARQSHISEIQNLDFYPIGIYSVPPEDFKEIREIGFNAVSYLSLGPDSLLSVLSAARADNLKILVSPSAVLQAPLDRPDYLMSLRASAPKDPSRKERGSPTFLKLLRSDTILGWYLEDEPEGRSISPQVIFNTRAALLQQGFRQPGVVVLNRSWRAVDYAPAADIIMTDPYPIPFEPLSWLSTSLDEIHAVVGGDPSKRVWAVIQAFGWNYGSKEVEEAGLGRDPGGDEVRTLTYLALTHRAQGLFYYVYKSGDYFIKEKMDLWEGLKKTVGEVRQIMPLVGAPEAKLDYKGECDRSDAWGIPAVHATIKEYNKTRSDPAAGTKSFISEMAAAKRPSPLLQPGYYLIAVNTLNEPAKATFKFKRSPSAAAFDIFTSERFPLSDSRLVLEFKPLERKILYFNPAL